VAEGMEDETKRGEKKIFVPSPKKKPAWAGWRTRLGMARAAPWASNKNPLITYKSNLFVCGVSSKVCSLLGIF